MRKSKTLWCKGVSDKDFIYDVFRNKGFVSHADTYLQTPQTPDFIDNDAETDNHVCSDAENS